MKHRRLSAMIATLPVAASLFVGVAAAPAFAAEETTADAAEASSPGATTMAQVTFADSNLAACVNGLLGQGATDPVWTWQVSSITTLDCEGWGITDLSGMEAFTALQKLRVPYNNIQDVSALQPLADLEYLIVSDNHGLDLSSVAQLSQLGRLEANRIGPLTDISPLASMTSLSTLDLGFNGLSDVTPLGSLTQLEWLYLGGNAITDVSALSGLTGLTQLYLEDNKVSDITPLTTLSRLHYLSLDNNRISDVSALQDIAAAIPGIGAGYLHAPGQKITLDPINVGDTQNSPLRGFTGQTLPVSAGAGPITLAPDGKSWTFTAENVGNTATWNWSDGVRDLTFSGTLVQDSTARPIVAPTLHDDFATTEFNTGVQILVLDNDDNPAGSPLDPSTLTLIDAAGSPVSTVSNSAGTYSVIGSTILFMPASGFVGDAPAVKYQIANVDGVSATANILVTVEEDHDGAGSGTGGGNGEGEGTGSGTGEGEGTGPGEAVEPADENVIPSDDTSIDEVSHASGQLAYTGGEGTLVLLIGGLGVTLVGLGLAARFIRKGVTQS